VYLFSADMKAVYLCLAQAVTAIYEEFKKNTDEVLARYAGIMRDRLPEGKTRFSAEPISLNSSSWLAVKYEASVVFNAHYELSQLPSEDQLVSDLREMVRLYTVLIARGGRDTLELPSSEAKGSTEGETIVERRRYRQHRKIERDSTAAKKAKRVHGYVCQCCSFDFEAIYGAAGANYIEAHHLVPLADLPEDVPVTQDPKTDFAVLCANCHRMIHRKDAPKTVAGLRALARVGYLIDALTPIVSKVGTKVH
jgi:5-methylcytosine-specific restriction protein A